MALIFASDDSDSNPGAPGTHVLVIGIGRYPHLLGGSHVGDRHFGLRQLTSAPISAWRITEWLLPSQGSGARSGLANRRAPLATVDLLISEEGSPDGEGTPTAKNIIAAVEKWYARCDRNPENVAMLYVCGHGLMLLDHVLLASDFGNQKSVNLWNQAISLDCISQGLRKCKARNQFLFFDCCRAYPVMVNGAPSQGHQIFDLVLNTVDSRNLIILRSTLEGSFAYAQTDQPSYFTTALLEGLSGFASERLGSGWAITNSMLANSIHKIMTFDSVAEADRQIAEVDISGHAILHELGHAPVVKTRVRCEPSLHMTSASFGLSRMNELFEHQGKDGPFRRDISPGQWTMTMSHQQGVYPTQDDDPIVMPPSFDKIFEVF